METGLFLTICAAAAFGFSDVNIRKAASQTGESFTGVVITAFIGLPIFAAIVFLRGEWSILLGISCRALILLGLTGIIHFVAGRFLAYNAFRLIGANKSGAFLRTFPIYAVIFGVFFLNETLTVFILLGVLCIVGGAVLVSTETKSVREKKRRGFSGKEFKGIIAGLGGALCWGTSPILIKPAVREIGSSFVGAFVSYMVAFIIMTCFLFMGHYRKQIMQLRLQKGFIPLMVGSFSLSTAVLLYYTALRYSPANMVAPLLGTSIFFVFFFSFLINRNIEIFTFKIALGMLVTALGAFLILH
ncbi:MAG: DMT family transporter [Deltaproteobacteria bacterium]|nr:DMT family transporter [Deltaproteobacteria bacterium]